MNLKDFSNQSCFSVSLGPKFDDLLEGGIQSGIVTEIYGEAGTGKTQLAMQLMKNCVDQHGPSIYIMRLQEIVGEEGINQILIKHLISEQQWQEFMFQDLPRAMQKYDIKLLIIDTIDQIFKDQYPKTADLKKTSDYLWQLAEKFPVLTINNITMNIQLNKLQPKLGREWSMMIGERLKLTKRTSYQNQKEIRTLKLKYSRRLPKLQFNFLINKEGIKFEQK